MGIFRKDEYDEVGSWRDRRLANIEEKMFSIEDKLQKIVDNQEKGIANTYDLVILSSNGITRVYDHGKEITDGVSELTFSVDNFPTIKYEKKITPNREV
jgi:hypothetical protein